MILLIEHADLPIVAVQFHRELPWRTEGAHDYRYDRAGQLADQGTEGSRRLATRAGLSDEDIDRMIKQAQKEVEPLLG